VQKTEV